jgi:hypothetical protein
MREFNFWTTIAFGLMYMVTISILGGISSIACIRGDNTSCAGSDRIITTPELLLVFTIPLIVLAILHTYWYAKSKDD